MKENRQAEILEYLKKEKYQHESNALKEMIAKGSEQYVLRENLKAALIQKCIDQVEKSNFIRPTNPTMLKGLEFKDGRRSSDITYGICMCGQAVYGIWKCCPYCETKLDWSKDESTN